MMAAAEKLNLFCTCSPVIDPSDTDCMGDRFGLSQIFGELCLLANLYGGCRITVVTLRLECTVNILLCSVLRFLVLIYC